MDEAASWSSDDQHIVHLIANALAHATERSGTGWRSALCSIRNDRYNRIFRGGIVNRNRVASANYS